MADILIIVGTEGGNARFAAEAAGDTLAALGHGVEMALGGDCADLRLAEREAALLCTSTYGFGTLPENLTGFADSLRAQAPDLSRLRYGVIALGDRTYAETFCQAGRDLDERLSRLGARRLGERLEVDACAHPLPDEVAAAWTRAWAAML